MDGVAAIVLAGGLSRRFGADKAAARWRGRTLLEHVLLRLPRPRDATLLVGGAAAPELPDENLILVADDATLPDGPLRGLVAGLEACPAPWAWVVACDMPLLSAPLLTALAVERRTGALAVVPRWDGRRQPLAALYAREAAPRLRAAALDGVRSLREALDRLPTVVLDEAWCRRHDPAGDGFRNVNRPEDLEALDTPNALHGRDAEHGLLPRR